MRILLAKRACCGPRSLGLWTRNACFATHFFFAAVSMLEECGRLMPPVTSYYAHLVPRYMIAAWHNKWHSRPSASPEINITVASANGCGCPLGQEAWKSVRNTAATCSSGTVSMKLGPLCGRQPPQTPDGLWAHIKTEPPPCIDTSREKRQKLFGWPRFRSPTARIPLRSRCCILLHGASGY